MSITLCCSVSIYYMFFFFKQKTAYEMRISDWSSDVCSSDLLDAIAIIADHIGPQHRTDAAIMHGRGQKGVTAAERRPVQALEQPLFAAKDQILGFDLNDVPTRVAADHLGANDADR